MQSVTESTCLCYYADYLVLTSTSTAMNVLRMIKLFGWENKMKSRIADKREEELKWIKKRQILDLCNNNLKCVVNIYRLGTYSIIWKLRHTRPNYACYLHNICESFCLLSTIFKYSLFWQTLVMKQNLTASSVFSSMSVFDMLRDQLHIVFWTIPRMVQGLLLTRLNIYLSDMLFRQSLFEPSQRLSCQRKLSWYSLP